jgi:hypothetical protein
VETGLILSWNGIEVGAKLLELIELGLMLGIFVPSSRSWANNIGIELDLAFE